MVKTGKLTSVWDVLLYGVGNSEMSVNKKMVISAIVILVVALVFVTSITDNNAPSSDNKELAHEKKWGIYVLDLENGGTERVYSSADTISRIRLNNAGDKLVFSQQIDTGNECAVEGSPMNLCEEIFSIRVDGEDFRRITDNDFWDLIPNWSADDSKIFFLSFRETLDIFMMNADGGNLVEVYDSGFHDSDLHCSGGKLAFTRNS